MKTTEIIEITREDFQTILDGYGHHMSVKIPVTDKLTGDVEMKTVLNNGMPYNPFAGKHPKQMGMSNNAENAKTAMRFIKDRASIYSSVFDFTTGDYKIID